MSDSRLTTNENNTTEVVIHKVMAVALGNSILRENISHPANAGKNAMWLARESNEPGMLSVQVITQEDTATGILYKHYAARFGLTANGWELATGNNLEQVKSRMTNQVTIENAALHVENFFQTVQTYFQSADIALTLDNLAKPVRTMQSTQTFYSVYATRAESVATPTASATSTLGVFGNHPRPRETVVIDNPELLKLITCPRSNKIMDNPVTLSNGTSCDRSAVNNSNMVEGTDFYANTTLKNIIKYLKEIYSPTITPELKLVRMRSLQTELADNVSFAPIENGIILKTGHCYDRSSLEGQRTTGRTPLCPITGVRIMFGDEFPEKTVPKVAAIMWPIVTPVIDAADDKEKRERDVKRASK